MKYKGVWQWSVDVEVKYFLYMPMIQSSNFAIMFLFIYCFLRISQTRKIIDFFIIDVEIGKIL